IGVGVLVMWHVQKALIDHLVEAASPQDKRASVALAVLAPKAGQGALLTPAGQKLVTMETIGLHRNIVEAMFPAAALHAPQREQLLLQWLMTAGHAPAAGVQPAQVEDNAYRNLIVAPLVIGLSLFFALVNLSVAASFVVCAQASLAPLGGRGAGAVAGGGVDAVGQCLAGCRGLPQRPAPGPVGAGAGAGRHGGVVGTRRDLLGARVAVGA
ncbi:MAG: hypothetical protein ACKOCJ_01920, partial [Burkholderiaceae bacterium]